VLGFSGRPSVVCVSLVIGNSVIVNSISTLYLLFYYNLQLCIILLLLLLYNNFLLLFIHFFK